jgi:hypothetical protein
MMPIFNPNGNEVSEIVLPNGNPASEVIAPDGTQVFGAIPDSVVDNFEAAGTNPPGPYRSGDTIADYYSGDTGSFQRTQTDAPEGSNALQLTSSPEAIFSNPGDGLPAYPQEGDTISFLIRDSSDGDFPVVLTNVQDVASPNCYGFELDQSDISIFRYDNGNFDDFGTELESKNVGASAGTWHFGEVSLPESGTNNISFELFSLDQNNEKDSSLGSVSTTDSNVSPSNRGIGWATRTANLQGNGVMYDRMRVES